MLFSSFWWCCYFCRCLFASLRLRVWSLKQQKLSSALLCVRLLDKDGDRDTDVKIERDEDKERDKERDRATKRRERQRYRDKCRQTEPEMKTKKKAETERQRDRNRGRHKVRDIFTKKNRQANQEQCDKQKRTCGLHASLLGISRDATASPFLIINNSFR